MIVVNRNWLTYIGMPEDVVRALEETRGLMLSEVDTFASGFTGGRYTSALVRETVPRTLLLIGMTDRHGAASGMTATTIEAGRLGPHLRMLSPSERTVVFESLGQIDHPTARAIAAAIKEAPCA